MSPAQKVRLWEQINRYVETCGGDSSGRVYGAISRQEAVVCVERVLSNIEAWWRDALRNAVESEGVELYRCCNCGCPGSVHNGRGRDDELHECLECECKKFDAPDARPGHRCPACDGQGWIVIDESTANELAQGVADCPTCAATPVGTPGVRDPAYRCEMYSPGTPTNGGCQGDGHYLCAQCMLLETPR